jgi:hypothetical protein
MHTSGADSHQFTVGSSLVLVTTAEEVHIVQFPCQLIALSFVTHPLC